MRTHLTFDVTPDMLAVGVALAALDRGFRPPDGPARQERLWTEDDITRAMTSAGRLGRGLLMTTIRATLSESGSRAFNQAAAERVFGRFPETIARRRAFELWPLMNPDRGENPFAPAAAVEDTVEDTVENTATPPIDSSETRAHDDDDERGIRRFVTNLFDRGARPTEPTNRR